MSLRRSLLRLAAPALLLAATACTTPFRADVTRFQTMPPPQGQTFAIQAADARMQGGIEFSMYAQLVSDRLSAQGYRPASEGAPATLVVSVDYGIDDGHEKTVSYGGGYGGYGGYGGGFGGGFGYGGFGFGGFGGRHGYYYGWADPFWAGGFGPDVQSYTYYVSHLDVKIRNTADARVLFEGRARARSVDSSLQHLVPNLVEAMFTGFPGRSGEDVLITVPPPPKPGTAAAPVNHGI